MWGIHTAPNRNSHPLYVHDRVTEGNEHDVDFENYVDDGTNTLTLQTLVRMRRVAGSLVQTTEFLLNGKMVAGGAGVVQPDYVQYTSIEDMNFNYIDISGGAAMNVQNMQQLAVRRPTFAFMRPLLLSLVVDPDCSNVNPILVTVQREKIVGGVQQEMEELRSFYLKPSSTFSTVQKCTVLPCPDVMVSSTVYIFGRQADNSDAMTKELLKLGQGVDAVKKIKRALLEILEISNENFNLSEIDADNPAWTRETKAVFGLLLPPVVTANVPGPASPFNSKLSTELRVIEGPRFVTSVTVRRGAMSMTLAPEPLLAIAPDNHSLRASYVNSGIFEELKDLRDICTRLAARIGNPVLDARGNRVFNLVTVASATPAGFNGAYAKEYAFARLTDLNRRSYKRFSGDVYNEYRTFDRAEPVSTFFEDVANACAPGVLSEFSRLRMAVHLHLSIPIQMVQNQRILPGVLQFESPGPLASYLGMDDEHGNVSHVTNVYSKIWSKGVAAAREIHDRSRLENGGIGVRLTRQYTPASYAAAFAGASFFRSLNFQNQSNYDSFPRTTWLAGLLPAVATRQSLAKFPGNRLITRATLRHCRSPRRN